MHDNITFHFSKRDTVFLVVPESVKVFPAVKVAEHDFRTIFC